MRRAGWTGTASPVACASTGARRSASMQPAAINIFALAIRHGLKAVDLKDMIFSYPTGASDISYMLG